MEIGDRVIAAIYENPLDEDNPPGERVRFLMREHYAPKVSDLVEATRYFMDRSEKVLQGKPVRDYDEAWSRLDNLLKRLED